MTLTCSLLQWAETNKVELTAVSTFVFSAFLFNSPPPGVKWTPTVIYAWIRCSLFAIFNRNNNHAEVYPDPKAASQETK